MHRGSLRLPAPVPVTGAATLPSSEQRRRLTQHDKATLTHIEIKAEVARLYRLY